MTATVDPHAGVSARPGLRGVRPDAARKEDARFLRGQGHYLDDLSLPGMLHAAILRSPVAHARITSIDTSAAEAHPKVRAVMHALLETLDGTDADPQRRRRGRAATTDKVRFEGQEVAMVIAEDRYAARDALELIDVEYDVLPAMVDARKALDPDAPVIVTTSTDGPTTTSSTGRRATVGGPTRSSPQPTWSSPRMLYPRSHPAPMETCGTIASMDKVTGKLTVWSTNEAPHAHRTSTPSSPGSPSTTSRSSRPTSAAASATRWASTPGTCWPWSARSSPASRSSGSRTAARTSCRPRSPATTT